MKYLKLFILVGFLTACASAPTGSTPVEDPVQVPSGYQQLCTDYPDSIFCEG